MRRTFAALLLLLMPLCTSAQTNLCARKTVAEHSSALPASVASKDIDVTYYRLTLDIATPPRPSMLRGAVTASFRSVTDSLRTVTLDLNSAMTVDSVIINAGRAPFVQSAASLQITLDRPRPRGDTASCTIYYQGVPQPGGFGSFIFGDHNQIPWIWSLSQPYGARDWWPCKDHPSDKADSVDIQVTCDSAFRVASNGRLLGVDPHAGGTATWRWAERYPIATYLVSVAVTNFSAFSDWFRYGPADSMEILNYVLPEHLVFARPALRKTVDMLSIFSELFGLYPFIREKYGHATFGRGGAMEHQTMTSTTSYDEYLIAHELAHQWFGDMITCRTWADLWLNEGFATYSEALYAEAAYGIEQYRTLMRATLDGAKKASRPVYSMDTASVGVLFDDAVVYNKGGSVLHMLRHVMGDSLFFRALKSYANDPALKYGTATTGDFLRVCEDVAGRQLDWFFNQWVYGTGYPRYRYTWEVVDQRDSAHVRVTLQQETDGTTSQAFIMPIDLRLEAGAWDTTVTLQSRGEREDFAIVVPQRPERVLLDPDRWVLADVRLENEMVLPTTYALLQNYPNPFNPGTTIVFDLPSRDRVTVAVYALNGQEVRRLIDGRVDAGRQQVFWDGTDARGTRVAAGVYLCQLRTRERTLSMKMVLVK